MGLFVLHPVEHDGVLYTFGQELPQLSESQGKSLLSYGVVSETKPEFITKEQKESHDAIKQAQEAGLARMADQPQNEVANQKQVLASDVVPAVQPATPQPVNAPVNVEIKK